MNNETMGDALRRAISNAIGFGFEDGELQSVNADDMDRLVEALTPVIASRLRGEAAQQRGAGTSTNETWIARAEAKLEQGEQQAVAWLDGDFAASLDRNGSATVWKHKGAARNAVADYTRPQPVAVAGDAVLALQTLADAVFGKGLGSEPDVYADHDKLCELQRMVREALSAASAAPADLPRYRLQRQEDGDYVGFSLESDPNGPLCKWKEIEQRQFLASLPAAPATVAGDAVALPEGAPTHWGDAMRELEAAAPAELQPLIFNLAYACDQRLSFLSMQVRHLEVAAALAQDRASQAGAAGVPEGWRLVPILPTPEMLTANGIDVGERTARKTWDGMLSVAPTPAAEGEVR